MTGYPADEVLGRNCRFLQGEDTDEAAIDELRRAIADERPATVELVNYRKDGTPFLNQLHISPVRDGDGRLVHFVGVQIDVTARRAAAVAQQRSSFLADAGPLLDASLDLESTLDAVTRLSVPFLGDVCIVEEIRHDEVHRLAATGGDQRARRAARADDPLVRAVRSGHSEIVTADVWFDRPATAMIVPLKARGTIRGAVVFATLSPGRRVRQAGPRAGRGPRAARRARDRQRAPAREPQLGRAFAPAGTPAPAAAVAGGHGPRGALPPGGRREPDRRRLLRRAAAQGRAGSRDRRRHRQGRTRRGVDGAGPPHAPHRRAVRGQPEPRAGRRQPHAAGRARRRRRALLHGRAVPGGAQRAKAGGLGGAAATPVALTRPSAAPGTRRRS